MNSYPSIVCGIDGSKASIHACHTFMSRMRSGRAVRAVSVIPREPLYDATAEVLQRLDADVAKRRKRLDAALAEVAAHGVKKQLEVSTEVFLEGRPYEVILDQAKAAGATLVVLGVADKGHLQRRLVGSTLSRVVGYGEMDVLLVPDGLEFGDGPVLASTDGSKHGAKAVDLAAALAKDTGRDLLIVGVANNPEGFDGEPMSQLGADILTENARKCVDDAAESLDLPSGKIRTLVRAGEPYIEITKIAEEESAGFIVMGTHGRTGLNRLLMGSTTERVLETASCPVLVTHA